MSNYKLEAGETAETFYYAKRGCAANPDDGVRTGDQAQADQYVIPAGYTGIKQTNQRVSSTKANTIQAKGRKKKSVFYFPISVWKDYFSFPFPRELRKTFPFSLFTRQERQLFFSRFSENSDKTFPFSFKIGIFLFPTLIQASSVSTAQVMDCYSCAVDMTQTVKGANPTEPTYDDIKTQDTSLCWQTFAPQVDSSIAATGTSGRCETSCFVQAYKYKVTTGPTNSPVTTYNWHLERGCKKADSKMKTGTVQSKDLFGVTITNYLCDYRNGSLCNSQLENYDTTLQLKTQIVRQIQCFTCETPAGNTDPTQECYTVPSTAKAVDCGDLS